MCKKNGPVVGGVLHTFTNEVEQKFVFHAISFWFQKVPISKVSCILNIIILLEFLGISVSVSLLENYVGQLLKPVA